MASRDAKIRVRDQKRLQNMIALNGASVSSKENRILLQFLQAENTCRLLDAAAKLNAGLGSAVLLRFGFDTLATGFWLAFVATPDFFIGEGDQHIPSDLSHIVDSLPETPKKMLRDVLDRPFNNDPSRTLLKDVLNPATHGDALVNVQRVGSAPPFGFTWAIHLRDIMQALTHNFAVILREEAEFDIHAQLQRLSERRAAGGSSL